MSKISIVIPIYNAEKHLHKCIKAVLAQSYKNFELILVDDKSTDRSLKICEYYGAKDERIIIIGKEVNEKVEKARIDGLLKCSGQYLMFSDSDDFLSKDAIQLLYEEIIRTNSDIVIGKVIRFYDKFMLISEAISNYDNFNNFLLSSKNLKVETANIIISSGDIILGSLCGKLYKSDLFKNIKLRPYGTIWQEDALMNLEILQNVNSIAYVDKVVYYYRYGGMTSKPSQEFVKNISIILEFKLEYIKKYKLEDMGINAIMQTYSQIIAYLKNLLRFESMSLKDFNGEIIKISEYPILENILLLKSYNKVRLYFETTAYTNFLEKYVILLVEKKSEQLYNLLVEENNSEKFNNYLKLIFKKLFT